MSLRWYEVIRMTNQAHDVMSGQGRDDLVLASENTSLVAKRARPPQNSGIKRKRLLR